MGYPQSLEELKSRIQLFLSLEGYEIAVAENNDRVIGWVAWSQSLLLVSPKIRIHIEGLVVDQAYRGRGIGKMLMQFVESKAAKLKPCIIDLTSGLRRADGTHDFYKSLGYRNEGSMAKVYLRKEI